MQNEFTLERQRLVMVPHGGCRSRLLAVLPQFSLGVVSGRAAEGV